MQTLGAQIAQEYAKHFTLTGNYKKSSNNLSVMKKRVDWFHEKQSVKTKCIVPCNSLFHRVI